MTATDCCLAPVCTAISSCWCCWCCWYCWCCWCCWCCGSLSPDPKINPRDRRGATLFFRSLILSYFVFFSPLSSSIFAGSSHETAHKKPVCPGMSGVDNVSQHNDRAKAGTSYKQTVRYTGQAGATARADRTPRIASSQSRASNRLHRSLAPVVCSPPPLGAGPRFWSSSIYYFLFLWIQ